MALPTLREGEYADPMAEESVWRKELTKTIEPLTKHLQFLQTIFNSVLDVPKEDDMISLHDGLKELIVDIMDIRQRQRIRLDQLEKRMTEWSTPGSSQFGEIASSANWKAELTLGDLPKIEVDRLTNAMCQKDDQIRTLNQQLANSRKTSNDVIRQLQDDLEGKDVQIRALSQQVDNIHAPSSPDAHQLEEGLNSKNAQVERLQRQLDNLPNSSGASINVLQQKVHSKKSRITSLNQQIETLVQTQHSLNVSADRRDNDVRRIEAELEESQSRVEELEEAVAAYNNPELDEISDRKEQLAAANTRLNAFEVGLPTAGRSRRKRKAAEIEESEEETSPSTNRYAQTSRNDRTAMTTTNWRIDEVRSANFSPHPLPIAVLEKLRTRIEVWNKTPG